MKFFFEYLGILLFISINIMAQIPDTILPSGSGVNIHFVAGNTQDLDMIKAAGFKFVRMDLTWSVTEQSKNMYNWSDYDSLTLHLEQRGIRALYILDYNNPIYTSAGEYSGPTDSSNIVAFTNWAAAAAKHFQGRNIIWEIWNEPNGSTFWNQGANVNQYSALALATCKAIRNVDPNAIIIGPACYGFDWSFLRSLCSSGALNYLDGISVHPYRSTSPETVASDYHKLDSLISYYKPVGRNISIICGEWGYTTVSVSLQNQADYIARQQLFNLANGVPLSIWYDFRNDGADLSSGEDNFGTITYGFVAKPAYIEITVLTRELTGYHITGQYSTGNSSDVILILENADGNTKIAAWTTGQSHQVSIPLLDVTLPDSARQIYWVDGNAGTGTIISAEGFFTDKLTSTPKYYSILPQVSPVPVPSIPVLNSPNNLSTGVTKEAIINWNPSFSYFQTKYRLQIATDSSINADGTFKFDYMVIDTILLPYNSWGLPAVDTVLHLSKSLEPSTKYYWHVNAFNVGGTSGFSGIWNFTTSSVDGIEKINNISDKYELLQNYPNPFNPSTVIEFQIPKDGVVTLKVYDILGREAAVLVNKEMGTGKYKVNFNAAGLASGIYLYKLTWNNSSLIKKIILLR